ncbi:MAG TPA: hypothetical protein DCS19_02055 [Flavobacterium sp.]|nr:hypothetical protein [Flavobacterium sp.]
MATKKEIWKTLLDNKKIGNNSYYNTKIITNGTVKIKIVYDIRNGSEDFTGKVYQDNEWKNLFWMMDMGNISTEASYVSDQPRKESRQRELMVKGMEFINVIF